MAKKIFVSFDYENDKRYKFLLEAWNENDQFDFTFDDHSSKEINSNEIARVKAALTRKINSAEITLIIIGKEANKNHPDSNEIGYKNWINFEVAKSIEAKNSLVAVKINSNYESPEELLGEGASWASSFTEDNIIDALNKI
ncbi:MAG: TIR domain-containing protein [Candidatus Moranbacteria bacterium]|nr:TIR domain-containing protein [Candidatus Moranbacteria bacterium]